MAWQITLISPENNAVIETPDVVTFHFITSTDASNPISRVVAKNLSTNRYYVREISGQGDITTTLTLPSGNYEWWVDLWNRLPDRDEFIGGSQHRNLTVIAPPPPPSYYILLREPPNGASLENEDGWVAFNFYTYTDVPNARTRLVVRGLTTDEYTTQDYNGTGNFFTQLMFQGGDYEWWVELSYPDSWDHIIGVSEHRTFHLTVPEPPPPVAVLVVPSSANIGEEITADGRQSTGSSLTYRFEFGDGCIITTGAGYARHAYSRSGTFIVRLTITDKLGRTATDEKTIVISGAAFQITLVADKYNILANETVTFTATITNVGTIAGRCTVDICEGYARKWMPYTTPILNPNESITHEWQIGPVWSPGTHNICVREIIYEQVTENGACVDITVSAGEWNIEVTADNYNPPINTPVTITAIITNNGVLAGRRNVDLFINNIPQNQPYQTLLLDPGESDTHSWIVTFSEIGEYVVCVEFI